MIATGSRHKFVGALGHTSEDETGLIYMRARWMDPSLGRFISEDAARDGANWFEYCRGNPVNAVDPDGTAGIGLANLEYVLYAMQYVGGLSFAQRLVLLTGSPSRIFLMLMDMSNLLAARSKGDVEMAALVEGMAAEGEFIGGSFNAQAAANHIAAKGYLTEAIHCAFGAAGLRVLAAIVEIEAGGFPW